MILSIILKKKKNLCRAGTDSIFWNLNYTTIFFLKFCNLSPLKSFFSLNVSSLKSFFFSSNVPYNTQLILILNFYPIKLLILKNFSLCVPPPREISGSVIGCSNGGAMHFYDENMHMSLHIWREIYSLVQAYYTTKWFSVCVKIYVFFNPNRNQVK